jgi:hypothetical protein
MAFSALVIGCESDPSYDRDVVYGACRGYWSSGGGNASGLRARLGVEDTKEFTTSMLSYVQAGMSNSGLVEQCIDFWMKE